MSAHSNHTPGPLAYKRASAPIDGEYDYAIRADIGGKPYVIAEVFGRVSEGIAPPAHANAAFIVRAYNAHDELLALVQNLTDELERIAMPEDGIGKLRHRARAAIAKVTGAA